jgi:hypothetical protein
MQHQVINVSNDKSQLLHHVWGDNVGTVHRNISQSEFAYF